ncbi:hypothetical protein JAAARDRAFT_654823 [Jaapia argillacea MUCL 33604]|uniref:MYND-type domain-containing protein n=1 Tax=Jaapia argillacea MUCL 33604 TaxID=933084 RepID=A0A067Q986_9AGAM|nr:hypothetical protein JAAARDRAFT_654823 [Jaapia argillacea MUCL 33604]
MDLPLQKDMEENFRRNPQRSIVAARLGSLPDCFIVSNGWHLVPRAASLGALDVFFHHLLKSKAPPPPPDWSAVDHSQYQLQLFSLLGLGNIGPLSSKDHSTLVRLIEAWPAIFEWCSFLCPPSITPPSVVVDENRDFATGTISFCLFSLTQSPQLLGVMRAAPGTIELATRLWLREDTMFRPPGVVFPAPSALLNQLLVPRQPEMLSKIVQVSGETLSTVIELALYRLITSSEPAHIDIYDVKYHMDLIFGLTSNVDHPLRDAFLNANAIVIATGALVALSREFDCGDIDDAKNPHVTVAIASILVYLKTFLEDTDGFTFISLSLRASLLLPLAWSGRMIFMSTEEEQELRISLLSALPRYLVYHSVIGAARSSLQTLKSSGLLGQAGKFSIGSREHWDRFEALLEDRARDSDVFDALEKMKRFCANSECTGRGLFQANLTKMCMGCRSVFYCSKPCQSSDWKRGDHRGF